jgi:osmotically-inducible protein OsmY
MMKPKFGAMCLLVGSLLTPMIMAYANDVDAVHPTNSDKNTAITSQIRLNLSANNSTAMANVIVKTSDEGVVWLSGTVAKQSQVSEAEAIAHRTEGVNQVNNQITVQEGP